PPGPPNCSAGGKPKGGVGVAEPKTKARPKLDRPRVYKVLLHNDDYTPMEFVVLILREVFNKSDADATAIMLHAHTHGFSVAGGGSRRARLGSDRRPAGLAGPRAAHLRRGRGSFGDRHSARAHAAADGAGARARRLVRAGHHPAGGFDDRASGADRLRAHPA